MIVTCIVYTFSVVRGMKGVMKLASSCVYLFFALLAYVFLAGGETRYIVETGFSAVGTLIQNFFTLATFTDPLRTTSFPQTWTMFYWAYWMVWAVAAPFFIGSISKGRTVKQTILGGYVFGLGGTFAPIADFTLLETAVTVARKLGIEPHVGSLLSSDVFYNKAGNTLDWGKMGVLAVEMESAALYCNAAEAGKRALAICTISDSLITGEELPAADRQTTFTQMMEIALGVAVEMAKK